jgi:hypothetical protein
MRKSIAHTSREVTLRAFLEDRAAPLDVRIDVAKRLLTAIARMHERDVVHGRLDPDAIRLTGVRSYRIVIGVDDAPSSGLRDTRFSPPEGEPTLRGDVFALGAILAELLTDAPPSIVRVVAVMTERDPLARYANAQVAMCALARAT